MQALIFSLIVEGNEVPIKKQVFGFVFFSSQMEDGDLPHRLFSMAELLLVVMAIWSSYLSAESGKVGTRRENYLKEERSCV